MLTIKSRDVNCQINFIGAIEMCVKLLSMFVLYVLNLNLYKCLECVQVGVEKKKVTTKMDL